MRSVKELHYFHTLDADEQAKKIEVLKGQIVEYGRQAILAKSEGIPWKKRNMLRRVDDSQDLLRVLSSDRAGDRAYIDYLLGGSTSPKILADVSPSYAPLEPAMIKRIRQLPVIVQVVFLVRDPLDRLWSHIRMHAKRFSREGQEIVSKSSNVLNRILNRGHETHITDRSDYRSSISAWRDVFGVDDMCVQYSEELSTPKGARSLCRVLDTAEKDPEQNLRVHEGQKIAFPEQRRRAVVRFLQDQYEFIAQEFGPLPKNWQQNYQLVA